jgi:hypothetical protein
MAIGGVVYYLSRNRSEPYLELTNDTSDTTKSTIFPQPTNQSTTAPLPTIQETITPTPSFGDFSIEDTIPKLSGSVKIGNKNFIFDPTEVNTLRPDIFNPGYFSIFDILVHLKKQGSIDLEYHFDNSLNSHIIDSINGESDWWYRIYYDGGWPEDSVFRIDHYPWKDGAILTFFNVDRSYLEEIYSVFENEVNRRKNNEDKLIIPKVIINGRTFNKEFKNVEVTPHNIRYDIYKKDLTTAVDVILSLADQGKINYELKWYESIGTARIVNSYWVEAVDVDKHHDRCGFVYEAGSLKYKGFRGNHIHLPTDVRILNSPDYVEFFWICI